MNFKQGKSHPCNVEPPRCMVPNMCNYISITTINSEEVFNIWGMGLSNPEPFIIGDHHWNPVSFHAQVPNQSSVNDFHISSGTWKDTKSCRVMIYWHIFHTKLDVKKIDHDTIQSMKPGNRRFGSGSCSGLAGGAAAFGALACQVPILPSCWFGDHVWKFSGGKIANNVQCTLY